MGRYKLPSLSWLILDTCFLIDFYSKQDSYTGLIEEIKGSDNTIVSIEFVRAEFIRSKTKDVVRAKSDFFAKLVKDLLPMDKEVHSLVQSTIEAYSGDMDRVSLTDLYLACTIQRYSKVYLLTRNHQDFPLKLFTRSHIFHIESDKDIKTYALYQYKQPSVDKIEAEVEEIPF